MSNQPTDTQLEKPQNTATELFSCIKEP